MITKIYTKVTNIYKNMLPFRGVGRAWVSAPSAPWCNALVATGVVRERFKDCGV